MGGAIRARRHARSRVYVCVDVLYQRVPRKRAKRGTGERTKNGRKRDRQGQTTRVEEDREARKRQRVAIKREREREIQA